MHRKTSEKCDSASKRFLPIARKRIAKIIVSSLHIGSARHPVNDAENASLWRQFTTHSTRRSQSSLKRVRIRGELCRELAYHDAGHRCTHSGPIAARPPATYDENTSKALHAFGLSGAVGRPGSKRDEPSHRFCEVSEGTSFQNSRLAPISSSLDPQTLQKYTRCSQDYGSSSIVIFGHF